MARFILLLLGVFAWVVLGYFGVHAPSQGLAARVQAQLQAGAEDALAQAGLADWAAVAMQGQQAVLTGEAPREEDRGAARAAVLSAIGPGGVWRGGVTVVNDRTSLAPPMSPFAWRAVRQGDRLVLAGGAPSRAARAELRQYAEELFPRGVIDRMRVARGAPDELSWASATRLSVAQLVQLEDARITVVDLAITVEGRAPDPAAARRVEAAFQTAPAVYAVRASIEAARDVAEAAPSRPAAAAPFRTAAACARALNEAGGKGLIAFSTAAVLSKESYPVLDAVAAQARRCVGMRVVSLVAPQAPRPKGQPADGDRRADDPAALETLARARAQAIADYLVLQGLAPERAIADVAMAGASDAGAGAAAQPVAAIEGADAEAGLTYRFAAYD